MPFRFLVISLAISMCVSTVRNMMAQPAIVEESPRIGQVMERPDGRMIERTYGFLAKTPTAKIVEPGELEIRFETSRPTPPAMVYLGINTLDEELDYPRFRISRREEGDLDDLRTEHVVRCNFEDLLQIAHTTPIEPRVTWRIAVYLPGRGERFFEGRVYFDPETLDDTVNVTYGPVVNQVTPNSVVVVFETDRPSSSVVSVGSENVVTTIDGRLRHEVKVEGLSPDTRYEYRVRCGKTEVRPYSFKTAGSEAFRFAAMVDSREGVGGGTINFSGVNGMALYSLASGAYYRGADFVLFAGDLINGYTTSVEDFRLQLEAFRRRIEPVHARIPIYESMGNHEALIDTIRHDDGVVSMDKRGENSAEAVFADMFVNPANGPRNEGEGTPTYSENVYYFDYGKARFFMLNNNYWWCSDPHDFGGNLEGYILPRQMQWLREEVKKADNNPDIRMLFFAAQEPPFPNGGHTGDAMWYDGGDTNGDGEVNDEDIDIVENRNEMWEIVAASPKTVAFIAGDEHAYSRLMVSPETNVGHLRKPDGSEAEFIHPVWQVTSGGAGAPFYDKELDMPWSGHLKAHSTLPHYAFFNVEKGTVTLEAYSETGQQIDRAILRRHDKNRTE